MKKYFHDFSTETSLHGWVFVGGSDAQPAGRVFWLLVLMCSTGATVWSLYETVSQYNREAIKINTEDRSATLNEAFFPSVIVCNISPLR